MREIIWYYEDKKAAIEQLERIKQRYITLKEAIIDEKVDEDGLVKIVCGNGDTWRLIRAHANLIGSRCNISYIDARIPTEIIEYIIKPYTTLPPYQGYHIYGDTDLL